MNRLHATACQRRPKRGTELRVTIVQHITARMKIAPTLLCGAVPDPFHPFRVRMPGDPGYVDAPAFQMKEEQYIIGHKPPPTEHFHCEEIASRQHVRMSCEEVFLGRDLASFGSWSDAVPSEDILHGLSRQRMAEIGECTDDAVIAPARVLSRHADH